MKKGSVVIVKWQPEVVCLGVVLRKSKYTSLWGPLYWVHSGGEYFFSMPEESLVLLEE
jgi:hypothetical protein